MDTVSIHDSGIGIFRRSKFTFCQAGKRLLQEELGKLQAAGRPLAEGIYSSGARYVVCGPKSTVERVSCNFQHHCGRGALISSWSGRVTVLWLCGATCACFAPSRRSGGRSGRTPGALTRFWPTCQIDGRSTSFLSIRLQAKLIDLL